MGNSACGGSRPKPKKSFKTQLKVQDLMSAITLQEYESKIKKFANQGVISSRQLAEALNSNKHLQSRDNALLMDILKNPFFQASKEEVEQARKAWEEAGGKKNEDQNGASGDK